MNRIAFVVALAVAACGPVPKKTTTAANGKSEVHCHEVNDTGSLFSHTECTTDEEQSQSSRDSEAVMRRTSGVAATPPATRGGH
jgi:hypothetical protein